MSDPTLRCNACGREVRMRDAEDETMATTYEAVEMGDRVKSDRTGRCGTVVGFQAPDPDAGEDADSGLIEVRYDGDSAAKHTDPRYLTVTETVSAARAAFNEYAESIGSTGLDEENAILSIGREHLPACAIAVLDDRDSATIEYYEWLTAQSRAAQNEHEAEVAAGHEWHGR